MDEFYKIVYHYEHVPFQVRKEMRTWYMENRSEAVNIFNALIDSVNDIWDTFGEPATFGDYIEDINPKYSDLIRHVIQPNLDVLNQSFEKFEYLVGEYGDIIGRIKGKRKSKIYITLKEVEL